MVKKVGIKKYYLEIIRYSLIDCFMLMDYNVFMIGGVIWRIRNVHVDAWKVKNAPAEITVHVMRVVLVGAETVRNVIVKGNNTCKI